MERKTHDSELVELGTASIETRGVPIQAVPEDNGYRALGLSDE